MNIRTYYCMFSGDENEGDYLNNCDSGEHGRMDGMELQQGVTSFGMMWSKEMGWNGNASSLLI